MVNHFSLHNWYYYIDSHLLAMLDTSSRFRQLVILGINIGQLISEVIPVYSGKFSQVHIFAIWLQSPQQKCSWVIIFAVRCLETTPTNSVCPRKMRNFAPHEHFSLYSIRL